MPDTTSSLPSSADADVRQLVTHLLERAGLSVDNSELDDLVELYQFSRNTSAMLHSDRAKELTGALVA